MTPDVDVLVAASRSDHPHHAVARAWLEATFAGVDAGTVLTLMPMVLASFLRLVSSPKIFKLPTPVEEAVRFVDALLDGGAHLAQPPSGHDCVSFVGSSSSPATTCRMPGWRQPRCTWQNILVSFDRDFKRLLGRNQFTLLEPGPV